MSSYNGGYTQDCAARDTVAAGRRRLARNGTRRVFTYTRRPFAIRAGARLLDKR